MSTAIINDQHRTVQTIRLLQTGRSVGSSGSRDAQPREDLEPAASVRFSPVHVLWSRHEPTLLPPLVEAIRAGVLYPGSDPHNRPGWTAIFIHVLMHPGGSSGKTDAAVQQEMAALVEQGQIVLHRPSTRERTTA